MAQPPQNFQNAFGLGVGAFFPANCRVTHFTLLILLALATTLGAAELRVPAFTAYALPNADGARFSPSTGLTRWSDPAVTVNWYGQLQKAGPIGVKLALRLPKGAKGSWRMTLAGQTNEAGATGAGLDQPVTVHFGAFQIEKGGYHRFALTALDETRQGQLDALLLDGPAIEGAHFNLKERRNAASVHLMYPVAAQTNIAAFYSEVTAVEDPTSTFYMACGWHRGYFGMQVNSPTERRIIFSVWDSGDEAVDRKNVPETNRVRLMAKGAGVYTGDFGNEGTGGHSHLKYLWKTGETQRFLVTAQPTNDTFTIFTGHWFHPEAKKWMLISSWNAPREGGWLKRPHGFSENFSGQNGHLLRKARYGNQWIRTPEGAWIELSSASFSHDATGRGDRLDRFMGVENGEFFLSHGGFVEGFSKSGDQFTRPSTGMAPRDLPTPPFDR